jgi:hypothetical protein
MYQYSVEERLFLVKSSWISGSIKNCQRKFVEKFCDHGHDPPSKRCIKKMVKRLETTGMLLDQHGRERQKMSEETVCEVTDRLQASLRKSLRRLSQEIGVSKSMCRRAAKKAGLHAYQFTVVHEFKEPDHEKRMVYCHWFQTLIADNSGILDYAWFSDEVWFHSSGYVNSQNTRLWASENPYTRGAPSFPGS